MTITGRSLDLSRYDGANNRSVAIAVESGNDRANVTAAFRRTNHDLRTP